MGEDLPIPKDIGAEYSLVTLAIEDNSIIDLLGERIQVEHFYNGYLGIIWKAIKECYKDLGAADESKIKPYIATKDLSPESVLYDLSLQFEEPPKDSEDYWAKRIETSYFRRQMLKAAREIEVKATDEEDTDEALLLASTSIVLDNLASKASCGDIAAKTRVDIVVERYLAHVDMVANNPDKGPVPTDLPDLNHILNGGWRRQEHYVIGARPGMGKSSLALYNIAWAAALRGIPTAYFSLEMSDESLVNRLLAALTNTAANIIDSGHHTLSLQERLNDARRTVSGTPLFVIDDCTDTKKLEGAAKRMKAKLGLGLIVVDYIQLLKVSGKDTVAEFTQNIASLTRIAKECDCPLVSVSQLNRKVEDRNDKKPMLADFAWSDRMVQDASAVIGIYRESRYNQEADKNKASLMVLKNRHGELADINVGWVGAQTMFMSEDNSNANLY